jgi:Holliday junction resolvasome RuvABC endonuclease subunit
MKGVIVACDPGLISSPTALVCFNPESKEILDYQNVRTSKKSNEHRMKEIAEKIDRYFERKSGLITFAIEDFVMRGKGGATLQQLRGAVISRVPYDIKVVNVHNITMKSVVGEYGSANKLRVAEGVLYFFRFNQASATIIRTLIEEEEWDMLDAFGIGICAYITTMGGSL